MPVQNSPNSAEGEEKSVIMAKNIQVGKIRTYFAGLGQKCHTPSPYAPERKKLMRLDLSAKFPFGS